MAKFKSLGKRNDKLKLPSINFTVSNDLCTGCGICEDVCPTRAIQIMKKEGLNVPLIDEIKCINNLGCSACIKVCSGIGINLKSISKKLFSNQNNYDYFLGYYSNCYSGYSNEQEIRYHCASGGMLSQFLIYLLKEGLINGAIVTKFSNDNPTIPETIIAKTEKEILSGKSSKYCPVSLNGVISNLKKLEGKFVVVGLPCHIHSLRKYEKDHPIFKNKIYAYFSIFCSSNRTFYATDYIFSQYCIEKNDIKSFAYRDDGCLGYMRIQTEENTVRIPYGEYYKKMRSYFKPRRCLLCMDGFSESADVSFGDIHIKDYRNDKIGVGSVIIRNPKINELFLKAKNENFIIAKKIHISTLKDSQKHIIHHKRRLIGLNIRMEKKFGAKTPYYDVEFNTKNYVIDYVAYFIVKFQRQIGNRKNLWFLITPVNKILALLGS